MSWIPGKTIRRAIEETWETITPRSDGPSPAVFLARLGDLSRSNSFLWVEAGLKVHERRSRNTQRGQALSRTLVLGTVAADIFAGYTTLRERRRVDQGMSVRFDATRSAPPGLYTHPFAPAGPHAAASLAGDRGGNHTRAWA